MSRFFIIFAVLLVTLSVSVFAETVYVTDELRLTVHKAADTSDQPFHTMVSGDSMDVLERNTYYARVRLTDGRVGWVRAAYLIEQEPAAARIRSVEVDRDRAQAKLASLESSLADRESSVSMLEQDIAARVAAMEAEKAELEQLRAENDSLNQSLSRYSSSVPVSWAAIAVLVMLTLGLFGGWWWMDRRSRASHGGFRVY